MNPDRWLQRILGRATCVIDPTARLTVAARIRNAIGHSENIMVGSGSIIAGELLVFAHGGVIRIGEHCYVGESSRLWSAASIRVGDRVLISHGVNIFDSLTHPISPTARHAQFRSIAREGHPREIDLGERPVSIDDDAWIGAGAIVLRGVEIGRGAVVAAGSVVTHAVPAFTIVGGNPARVIRELDEHERR